MSVQAKTVDPNGKPKSLVVTHDRVSSGKEFAFFQHILGIMALGCVPDSEGRFDASGRQMVRLLTPEELVERAETLVRTAMQVALYNDWVVETAPIDEIYGDLAERPSGLGYMTKNVSPNTDDDIPF